MVLHEGGLIRICNHDLIREEPLSIRVEGRSYVVVMRTPGEEIYHAAGFCLAEGLVNGPGDFATIGICKDTDANVVTVTLTPEMRERVSGLLERRGFVSQTSCGICGKELIEDLHQILKPSADATRISMKRAMECVDRLTGSQTLYKGTGGAHAAMIFDYQLNPLAMAEDVGRHNALDKAIGKVLMDGKIETAWLAAMSSRISYELVQKAARAGLSILVGMSRPTSMAVELSEKLNMTIAWRGKKKGFGIFCGKERFEDV
ncbi:MAG: formate dehydrogenase accessory sulfurtransferase FdhD [Desulfobacterales bacterium]|nr:formate dehydrogenase accessory sulfurtransferase FdhD [Desulfobacterales bacterium]